MVLALESFDGDTAVVQRAEAGSRAALAMMQTGDGNEDPRAVSTHQATAGIESRADDECCGFVDAFEGRCVTAVESAFTAGGQLDDPVDVGVVVKSRDVFARCSHRLVQANRRIQTLVAGFAPESVHAIGTEGMLVAKAVAF